MAQIIKYNNISQEINYDEVFTLDEYEDIIVNFDELVEEIPEMYEEILNFINYDIFINT